MGGSSIQRGPIERASKEFEVDEELIRDALTDLREELQDNAFEIYESAFRRPGNQNHLTWFGNEGSYFAFHPLDISQRYLPEYDQETVFATSAVCQLDFRDKYEQVITMDASYAETFKDPGVVPVFVPHPKGWDGGQRYGLFYLSHLFRRGLTPAEAIDYYACERYFYTPSEWGDFRKISAEAVRKNIRQAKGKIQSDETKYWEEKTDIKLTDIETAEREIVDGEIPR